MKETLIVDGYNVINAWPELIRLKDQNLEHARDKLIDMLAGYGAYKGQSVMVVFDAQEVAGLESIEIRKKVEVIFTKEGETADSFIERTVYSLGKKDQKIYVVTSDWAEQSAVFWAGAYRISTRELYNDYLRTVKEVRSRFTEKVTTASRHEVEGRLRREVLKQLNKIRHDR